MSACLLASLAWGPSGCSDEPTDSARPLTAEIVTTDDLSSGHIGRIHLVLQPRPDEIEPEPQLQVHGHFIEYHGVSEAFVRARVNLPTPAWEQLVPGQCVASDALLADADPSAEVEGDEREVSMLDAGDLRIVLGTRELVAPLALVPDIVPWLSGVEYEQVDDRIPRLLREPDGTSPVMISIDGAAEGGLEAFAVSVSVPVPLALEAAKVAGERLTIDWRPPGASAGTLVLRLQAFSRGDDGVREPAGEEVTCLVADTGRANLALTPLANAGLGARAELLRVSASRFDTARVQAGSFGDVDVFVELRAQEILPLL